MFQLFLFLLGIYIADSENLCGQDLLSNCLISQKYEIQLIIPQNSNGYSYSFWSIYVSADREYEPDVTQYINGQLLIQETQGNNKELRTLLILDWTGFTNTEKNIHLDFINSEISEINQAASFQFESLSFEGKWIFYQILYEFPHQLQILLYDLQQDDLKLTHITTKNDLTLEVLQIQIMGDLQYSSADTTYFLTSFFGKISKLDVQLQELIFISNYQEFKNFFQTQFIPKPFCQIQKFESSKISNLIYQYGLIQFESWVQVDYTSTLNLTISLFGVDFLVKPKLNIYQKLIDLSYCFIQAWTDDLANGVFFQTLNKTQPDFTTNFLQTLQDSEISFKTLKQNLKLWHFVSLFYGFDSLGQPHQQLKMWFMNGETYEISRTNEIFSFFGLNITIRSASKFMEYADGFTITSASSKITICIDQIYQLLKVCHHSCLDCDGPDQFSCLSCKSDDQRFLENRQCKCNFGSIENTLGKCVEFKQFYVDSISVFIQKDQGFYKYGYFPIPLLNTELVFPCPQHYGMEEKILCVECITDPENFYASMICKTDYILNDQGQYELQQRTNSEISLYYFDEATLTISQCVGCKSYCDPSQETNCFYNLKLQDYVKCQDQSYFNDGQCDACHYSCLTCQTFDQCTSCDKTLNLILDQTTKLCVKCPINCVECINSQTCTTCDEFYTQYQGICYKCGQNCKQCIFQLNKITGLYYNRCVNCIDNNAYFLTLTATGCQLNLDPSCLYKVQFHKSWFARMTDNTIFHLFQPKDLLDSQITNYCALCQQGFISLMSGGCVAISTVDPNDDNCAQMYQIENFWQFSYGQLVYHCQVHYQVLSPNTYYSVSNGCQYYIRNCIYCYFEMCLMCFPGYYADFFSGQCNPCPEDLHCYKCQLTSKTWKNGWKVWYRVIYGLTKGGSFLNDIFGTNSIDNYEIVCMSCLVQYEMYQNLCIKECAENCAVCEKRNLQNYCIKCQLYENRPLSLYNGECFDCPRNCLLCKPKSKAQLNAINPYFNNQDVISSTHTCLKLNDGLSENDYYYDSTFKQFFKVKNQNQVNDPNSVTLNFNLYCDTNKFQQDLQKAIDETKFLQQNVQINELITFDPSTSNFGRIENLSLFQYMSSQQISEVELTFKLQQDCRIDKHSYIFTTLTQNIFFLNSAKITIFGNKKNVYLFDNLEILGFDVITISDLNLLPINQNQLYLHLQSSNQLHANLNNIIVSSQEQNRKNLIFNINLTNPQQLMINNMQITNSSIIDIQSFFQFLYKSKLQNSIIIINGFIINKSVFTRSNVMLFSDQVNTEIVLNQITISNAQLSQFSFYTTINQIEINLIAVFSNFQILQTIFSECNPIFLTYFLKNLSNSNTNIIQTNFINSALFQTSLHQTYTNFSIDNSNIVNSYLIQSKLQNFVSCQLFNVFISKITYVLEQSFIQLVTSEVDSLIMIKNLTISQAQILNTSDTFKVSSSITLIQFTANIIYLTETTILRNSGLTEFIFSSAQNVTIISFEVSFNNVQKVKPIITDSSCERNLDTTKFNKIFIIEDTQYIIIKSLNIVDMIVFDSPVIQITSIATQIRRRQEQVDFDNIQIINSVIQKTQTINSISMIEIKSEQQISINILNSIFQSNIYYSIIKEIESESALILNIIAIYSKVLIVQNIFESNIIFQSQNSLLNVYADSLIIEQSTFSQNNIFNEQHISHIDWKFNQNKLTRSQFQNYIQCLSLSGNGNFQISQLMMNQVTLLNTYSIYAGCFKVALQNQGEFQIADSSFKNISTQPSDIQSYGGCFEIIDQTNSLNLMVINSLFSQIYGSAEGGGLYINPTSENVTLGFKNITVIDCYSLSGSFLKINFLNNNQKLNIKDSSFFQTLDGFTYFQQFLKSSTILQTAMIQIDKGTIALTNILLQLYVSSMMEITNQFQVSLKQIYLENLFYKSNSIISITLSQDLNCSIEFYDLQIKNSLHFTQNQNYNQQLIQFQVENNYDTSSNCLNNKNLEVLKPIISSQKLHDYLIKDNNQSISNFVQILQIKQNDQIRLKKSSFANNKCQNCQNGLIYIEFKEKLQNISQVFDLQLIDNECGQNGCFYLVKLNQKIQETNYLDIIDLLCIRNKALKGACITSDGIGIKLQNSLLSENEAENYGGAIYFNGQSTNLILVNNLIISNKANLGGAIFIENDSLPDLQRTLNYLNNNTGNDFGNISSNQPIQLSILFNKILLQNYHKQKEATFQAFILNQEQNNENIFYMPSGQEISQYQFFDVAKQEYSPLKLSLRIVALNSYYEQQKNLNTSQCIIHSGKYNDNNSLIFSNNYTNLKTINFDPSTGDYNLDNLILYFGNENQKLILEIFCNSILIPVFGSAYPYRIISYEKQYTLQLTIITFPCQLGEYKNQSDFACYLCDISKKQYSVQQNSSTCNFMDDTTTEAITPAQLKLKPGYWRPYINSEIIEKCSNKLENCLGGWMQGDNSCAVGQIGACCEACDNYNLRGNGQFTSKKLYQCNRCEQFSEQILFIILVSIWNLISIYLTSKGVENMLLELLKNTVGHRQLLINNNKQTGPIMKMFVYYLQIVSIIFNFNVEIPQTLKDYYVIFGNSQAILLINTDCFLVQLFEEGLIYQQILFSIFIPIFYGLMFFAIYFLASSFQFIIFNKVVVTTSILYLFCYFQMQNVQLLISSLSYRTISGIQWVQSNLAYQFYNETHKEWIPYIISLLIVIGIIIPVILFVKLFFNRFQLHKNSTRKQIGYLYLEYQPKAYFWEIMRIISRELIIISITYYQDYMAIKGSLLLAIVFIYSILINLVQPFKTKMLNRLDHISTLLCTFTLIVVLSLSQTTDLYSLLIVLIVLPNIALFIQFILSLFKGYFQAYEMVLDKLRDILREKLQKKVKQYPKLNKILENRQNRRQVVMKRFQSIKHHLFSTQISLTRSDKFKNILISTYRSSSGITSPRDYNIFLFKPQQILSTNTENNGLQTTDQRE